MNEVGLKGLNSSRSNCLMDCILYDERKMATTLGKVVMRKKTKRPMQKMSTTEGQIKGELLLNKAYSCTGLKL